MQPSQPSLNPALRSFWRTPARIRVLKGGRSSSKSTDAAGFVLFLAQHCKIRVVCARQYQNRIEESVYTLLKIQIARFGLEAMFEIQQTKIICRTTGSEFIFYGLWRSIDEIKSLEDVDILWIEEAHNLTEEQWDTLEPTIRKDGSQVWLIFNPRLVTDFVWRRFVVNPPPDTVVRHINYDENPFLSNTIRKVIDNLRATDEEKYRHIYLGEPNQDDDESIIKRSWLLAAINGHTTLGLQTAGSRRMGFDVADSGKDSCALVAAHGCLATWADMWQAREDELLKSCTRAWSAARERDCEIIYDAIGVGAGAGAKFNELNETIRERRVGHDKFFAGGAVVRPDAFYGDSRIKNKDFFANIKAQAWWLVADRLKNTFNAVKNGQKFELDEMIFIDGSLPHLEQLIDELTAPKKDYDQAGRVKVESKKDLEKRDISSPNLGDAFIMAFLPTEMKRRSFFG